jgi:uncharacterized membrane protein YhfC
MTTPMFLFMFISIGFTLALFFYSRKKFDISIKTVLIGALTWFVFSQILEKILHLIVFSKTDLINHPWMFSIYGALAAGVFEEYGRYFAFKKLLKKYHEWKDGLGYGIGHGGFEAILLGITMPLLVVSLSKTNIENVSMASNASAQVINGLLQNANNYMFWIVGSLERIMAVILHITLSFIVLYAVRIKNIKYLFLAVGYHALVDFPAALYQGGILNLATVEAILFAFTLLNLYLLKISKKYFS